MQTLPNQNPAQPFVPAMSYEEHLWRMALEGLNDLIATFVHAAPTKEAQEVALGRAGCLIDRLYDFVERLEMMSDSEPMWMLSNTVHTLDLLLGDLGDDTVSGTYADRVSTIVAIALWTCRAFVPALSLS